MRFEGCGTVESAGFPRSDRLVARLWSERSNVLESRRLEGSWGVCSALWGKQQFADICKPLGAAGATGGALTVWVVDGGAQSALVLRGTTV